MHDSKADGRKSDDGKFTVNELKLYQQECLLLACVLTSPIHDTKAFALVLQELKNYTAMKTSIPFLS